MNRTEQNIFFIISEGKCFRGSWHQGCSKKICFLQALFSHLTLLSQCSIQWRKPSFCICISAFCTLWMNAGRMAMRRKTVRSVCAWQAAVNTFNALPFLKSRNNCKCMLCNFTRCRVKLPLLFVLSVKWLVVSVRPCRCQTDAARRRLQINNIVIIGIAATQIPIPTQCD